MTDPTPDPVTASTTVGAEVDTTAAAALAALASGQLDLDALRGIAGTLGTTLANGVRTSSAAIRDARGQAFVDSDRYELIRRLADARDVLDRLAAGFTRAAQACTAEIGAELTEARDAEDTGGPPRRMVVPWGPDELVVAPKTTAAPVTVDHASLIGLLADITASQAHDAVDAEPGASWQPHDTVAVARNAMTELWGLISGPKVKTTAVDALARKLAGQGLDRLSGMVSSTVSKGDPGWSGDVTVVREAAKARRRG